MIFLNYKQPKAEYVQFQRFILGLFTLSAVLTERIEFIQLFLTLSVISFVTTMNYSPTTLFFKALSYILKKPLFVTAPQYVHSYMTNKLAEIFEDLMRLIGGTTVLYLYTISPIYAWIVSSFMGIWMMISSFFGFCLSSLVYIGYKRLLKIFGIYDAK